MINTAEIIAVGTELLLGEVVNTNAAYISRKLADFGISVYHSSVIGDNVGRLKESVALALSRADLVVTSGGLGPTCDDLTKETVAEALGLPMHEDAQARASIESFFATRGNGLESMTENNLKQALVPEGARVLQNPNGTAPGLIVTKGEKTVILLPGPPRELKPLLDGEVSEFLEENTESLLISHNLHIIGMGESAVEENLRELMNSSENPTIAPYAGDGEARLRITAKASARAEGEALCKAMIEKVKNSPVGEYIYGEDVGSLENALVKELSRRGMTIAAAESCTGGLIAKRITDISGSSAVFLGSCVTYANEAKVKLLGVKEETLRAVGAVSKETAAEMARGVRLALGSDIAISSTGIAGPLGGTPEKPVGTVYIGISTKDGEQVTRLKLSPKRSRDYLRTCASSNALSLALREVLKL